MALLSKASVAVFHRLKALHWLTRAFKTWSLSNALTSYSVLLPQNTWSLFKSLQYSKQQMLPYRLHFLYNNDHTLYVLLIYYYLQYYVTPIKLTDF